MTQMPDTFSKMDLNLPVQPAYRAAFRWVSSCALILVLCGSHLAFALAPEIGAILLETLASPERLPSGTRLVLAWCDHPTLALGLQWLVFLLAIAAAFFAQPKFATFSVLGGLLILSLHLLFCAAATILPLIQVFTPISISLGLPGDVIPQPR